MKIAIIAAVALVLTGCASAPQQPLLKHTSSGYAEGIFTAMSVEDARSKITERCVSRGMMVEDSNGSSIICARTLTGMQAVMGSLIAGGNSYSTTPQAKTRWTIFKMGSDVKVVANPFISTQMAFGQVRSEEMNTLQVRNELQQAMFDMGAK